MPVRIDFNTGPEAANVDLEMGERLYVLGANGSGKSSLMHHIYRNRGAASRRISAHRQTWFESDAIQMSPAQKQSMLSNMASRDQQPEAVWKDAYASQRPNMALYDLLEAENTLARQITAALRSQDLDNATRLADEDSPCATINEIMSASNLPIQISITDDGQVVARKHEGAPYGVASLSDGERNALLIAAEVLTAESGSLLIIDEPERHLHRSIISPLLRALFDRRSDCAFVVSTHEVMLPVDDPDSRTLLLRGCEHNGSNVSSWDFDLLDAGADLEDAIRKDILGSRRNLLVVEGVERSLDAPLYGILFPGVSVVPKSSCRDVQRTVEGLRSATHLHWVLALGIVDNDGRCDVEALRARGIHALHCHSVESLYYHPKLMEIAARRHLRVTEDNDAHAAELIQQAVDAALDAIAGHSARLCRRATEHVLRSRLFEQLPTARDIDVAEPIHISLSVSEAAEEEGRRFGQAIEDRDLGSLVSRYPVRETQALHLIAERLRFADRSQYERTVRRALIDSNDLRAAVQTLFEPLMLNLDPEWTRASSSLDEIDVETVLSDLAG